MIEVELRRPDSSGTSQLVAAIRLEDDLSYTVSGPKPDAFGLDRLPVMDPERGRGIYFSEDPEWWLRHLDYAFRTPYLVPVVVSSGAE